MDMESVKSTQSAVSFLVGERFRSFGEVEDKVKRYEGSTFTKFWKRDCRTAEAARRWMDRPLVDCIKYYEITYHCIHGGRKFKARGEGKRATNFYCVNIVLVNQNVIIFYLMRTFWGGLFPRIHKGLALDLCACDATSHSQLLVFTAIGTRCNGIFVCSLD